MKRVFFSFILSLLPILVWAASWHTYTNTNYLNDLRIVGTQVWWGATGGVVRYDNADSSYTIYRNTEGLGGINVQAVEADEEGNLWFGLANGVLNRLGPHGGWRRAYLEEGINALKYYRGYVWAATEKALVKFDPHTWFPLEICEQPGIGLQRDKPVRCLFFQGDTLWAGTEGGISYIDIAQTENLRDPAQWTYFTSSNSSLANDIINAITSYQDTIYAGTSDGIYKFANGSWRALAGGWHRGVVYDLKADSINLLVVTEKGVWSWNGSQLDSLKCPSSVPRKLGVGPQGELWVGTWGEGTYLYRNGRWYYPFKTQGPIGNKIADMALDSKGTLWLACRGYGMSGFDGQRWENFTPIPDPTRDTTSCSYWEAKIPLGVCTVAADRLDNKWFGLWSGGVIKLDPEGNQTIYDEDNSDGKLLYSDPRYPQCVWNVVVNKIMVDSANNKYFANFDQGVVVLSSAETKWLRHPEDKQHGLLEDLISAVMVDGRGRKWFGHLVGAGSSGGISLLDDRGTPLDPDDDEWKHFSGESDGLLNNTVNCFALALDGSIWIGTDEGVSKYDPWSSTVLKPGYMFLPNYYETIGHREVRAIEIDTKGNKWFGTSNGLLKYEEENFLWREYTTENSGLLDEKINCLLLDKNRGYLWIGTDKGLSMYELEMVEPKLNLSQLLVYPSPFLLSQGENEVRFKNLTANSVVYIFTVNGELVREIDSEGSGLVTWDGRNQGGNLVAGGIYLWVVRDKNGNNKTGKIAVIR